MTSATPASEATTAPAVSAVRWIARGDRLFARLTCRTCGSIRTVSFGDRFAYAASPNGGARTLAIRAVHEALSRSEVEHHRARIEEVVAFVAEAALHEMQLGLAPNMPADLPFIVQVSEASTHLTAIRSHAGSERIETHQTLVEDRDPNPLATLGALLQHTIAEGQHEPAASLAIARRGWRLVGFRFEDVAQAVNPSAGDVHRLDPPRD